MTDMASRDGFCPVARGVEVVGDRWSLLIVREMLRGVRHFNGLERSVPGISRSILAARLRHLEREGVIRRTRGPDGRPTGYRLTETGRDLGPVLDALNAWAVAWYVPAGRRIDVDPDGLMEWVWRHVMLDALPSERVVIGFELCGRERRYYWLVLEPDDVSLCPDNPGFPEQVQVKATTGALYELVIGRVSLARAIATGSVEVEAPPALLRALPRWFRLRPDDGPAVAGEFAPVARNREVDVPISP